MCVGVEKVLSLVQEAELELNFFVVVTHYHFL